MRALQVRRSLTPFIEPRHSRVLRNKDRDGPPELGIPATGAVRPGLWRAPGLVDPQHPAKAGPGKTTERRRVQTVTGTDLGEAALMRAFITSVTDPEGIMIPKIAADHSTEAGFQKLQRLP